jgi:hypothetical protein
MTAVEVAVVAASRQAVPAETAAEVETAAAVKALPAAR